VKSIKVKLVLAVGLLAVVALGVLAGTNYWQAKKMLVQAIEKEIVAVAEGNSNEISAWLEVRKTEIGAISRTELLKSGNHEAIMAYLASEVRNNSRYETIVYTDKSGQFSDHRGVKGTLGNRDYFQRVMKGETVVTDPVISMATGKMIVMVCTPLREGDRITGMLFGAVDIEALQKIVADIRVAKTGYAYIARGDGTLIIHPNKQVQGKVNQLKDPDVHPSLRTAAEKMAKGEKGIAEYEIDGVRKYLAYSPVTGTSWAIGVNMPAREVTEQLDGFSNSAVLTITVVLLLAMGGIMVLAEKIVRPLRILGIEADKIAAGDLGINDIAVNSRDELGNLARCFERMAGNLRGLVREIEDSSVQVAAAAEELTANSEQAAEAATQVAVTIRHTASGVGQQVEALDKAVAEVEEMVSGAEQEVDKINQAKALAGNAVEAVASGNAAVTMAIDQMKRIRQTVVESASVVSELGERSKEIGAIVATISGIAGQTNLLALNAAIEAARAGEQGRGFAVVAEEVRKLAEQSQEAAKQIAILIGDVQSKTANAVEAMKEGTQAVKQGELVVGDAGKAFQAIDAQVQEVAVLTREAVGGVNKVAANSQKVLVMMSDNKKISHDIYEQTQTISAATEEEAAAMEEVASASQHLSVLAEKLQTAVSRFKL